MTSRRWSARRQGQNDPAVDKVGSQNATVDAPAERRDARRTEDDAEPGTGDAGSRLRNAVVRPSRRQGVVAVLLAILGFAFVVQVRDTAANDTYAGLRESDLIQRLDGLNGTAERARREIDRLEERKDALGEENQGRAEALNMAQHRLRTLNVIAGLVPVSGRGLRVTVKPSEQGVGVGSLLDMVQELRNAGAEAMEFNDSIRLGMDSSFENGPGGVELDDQLLDPPYVLDVIGDPRNLRAALTFGPVETFQELDGAAVTVEELDQVQILSVRDSQSPRFVKYGSG